MIFKVYNLSKVKYQNLIMTKPLALGLNVLCLDFRYLELITLLQHLM